MTDVISPADVSQKSRMGLAIWFIVTLVTLVGVFLLPLACAVIAGLAVAWTWGMRFSDRRYTGLRWLALVVLLANLASLFLATPVTTELGPVEVTEITSG